MQDLQPKRFNPSNPIDREALELGLAFEDILGEGLARRYATMRPPEIVSPEGVYMSPDGINPTECAGEEYKATRMSAKPRKNCANVFVDEYGLPNDKFIHWFFQIKGYAKWLEVQTFLLRVFFINGDYVWRKGDERDVPPVPRLQSFKLEFTEQELDDNWAMLIRHAKQKGLL